MRALAAWVAGMGILSIGSACRHAEVSKPQGDASAAAYYPLAVGNQWVYQSSLLGERKEQTVEVLREENGYYLDSQGGELAADGFGIRDRKRYLLREPLEPGKSWTNVVSVSSVEHYRILDITPCQVPAGRFESCVRVESRNRIDAKTSLVNELTFARGVGIARLDVFAEVDGRRIPQTSLLLHSYRVQVPTSRP